MKKIYSLFLVLFIVISALAKEPTEPKVKKKHQPKLAHSYVKAKDWGIDLIIGFMELFLPVWGTYSEGGTTNRDIPLLTSDRKNQDINKLRGDIIFNIHNDKNSFKNIYTAIYNNAKAPQSTKSDYTTWDAASIAKDAAMVYWLGVDIDGNPLPTTGPHTRQFFYDVAKNTIIGWTDRAPSFSGKGPQVYRAKENIMLMQADNFLEMSLAQGATMYPSADKSKIKEEIFEFTYQLYSRANNFLSGGEGGALTSAVSNNMTQIVAAAVGMGAIVLNDRGTFFFLIQRKPDRWANAAHAYIKDVKRDKIDESFAEGPYYYRFTFEALLPFFQAFKNFTDGNLRGYGPYYKCTLCFDAFSISNYYAENDYLKTYDWYNNIKMPNGDAPTIDDSWSVSNNFGGIALSGEPRHSIVADPTLTLANTHMNLSADYLTLLNYPVGSYVAPLSYHNDISGDMVVRANTDKDLQHQHYIHLNTERRKAINGGEPKFIPGFVRPGIPFILEPKVIEPITWGHEHADIGNFIISAGEDVLALDPAYYGDKWLDNYNVNQGNHHNVITVDGYGPDVKDETVWSNLEKIGDGYKMSFKANYWNYVAGYKTSVKAEVKREISIYDIGDERYYDINDYVTNRNWFSSQWVAFNLNGNGYQANQSYHTEGDNVAVWNYPCLKDNNKSDNWKMTATLTTFLSNQIASNIISTENEKSHGNFGGVINSNVTNNSFRTELGFNANIEKSLKSNGNDYGLHSRLTKQLSIAPDETAHFKTTIQIKRCESFDTIVPKIVRTDRFNSHLLYFNSNDSLRNFHMSRIDGSTLADSVTNPFDINSSRILYTNAKSLFFSYSLNEYPRFGCCVAKCNFRKLTLEHGDSLVYNDTTFIKADRPIDAHIRLAGKYKYQGYVKSDSDAAVSFFLPDLDTSYQMKPNADTLIYNYDDSAHIMTLFVKEGTTHFVFELTDPCASNCYFPPAIDSVKTTFNFDNSLVEALTHKLTITTPSGFLKINNGSTMSICPGNWLRNTDSLILEGGCLSEDSKPGIVTCYDVHNPEQPPSIKVIGSGGAGRPSTIIVNEQAALILDSGSYTRVGNNTTITVKPFGTLIIRKNAILDIGDEKNCGYGLIICYNDSYIHFEDSADIKFWKIENDTNDKQKFFIFLNPPTPLQPAHSGVESSIYNMLTTIDTVIHLGTSVPICNISQIKPDYGINNRDWGWANFVKPKAWARLPKQTFCPGECPEINFDAMLNNINTTIKFYRIDTSYKNPTPLAYYTEVANPYLYAGGVKSNCDTFIDLPVLKLCHASLIQQNKWYLIKIKVMNDCGEEDSIQIPYFMLQDFDANFVINQTSCIDSVVAIENTDSFTRFYRDKTKWHVHYIDTAGNDLIPQQVNYGGDWEYTGIDYPTNFRFPGFKWVGGVYYAVSHTVSFLGCGQKTVWDTIFVAPGANIAMRRPTLYGQNISNNNTSVQLKGYVSNADSFNWSPTTWLDLTDANNPISTPTDSITYVLSAYKDGCVARDTAHIAYNRYANAGYNDTLCLDSTHQTISLIGFPYDMSLFLGMLYHYSPTDFMDLYNTYNTDDAIDYFKYFTHFMHDDEFAALAAGPCDINLYDFFVNTVEKQQFFNKPWFREYYRMLTQSQVSVQTAFQKFNSELQDDPELNGYFMSLANWSSFNPSCVENLFQHYNEYRVNRFNEITTTWSKIMGTDTTDLSRWNNYFAAIVAPRTSSKYLFSVITPSRAEIDEITLLVDTILTPLFAPALQFDSTVFFTNYTEPISNATTYEWNFGDGSTNSLEQNPIHTFPAFDSNYVVCLTASNKCSSWQYCDTVWIDSLHLGGTLRLLSKAETNRNKPAFFETNISTSLNDRLALNNKLEARSKELVALQNYPNPFNQATIIDYQIWQNFSQAELRITNILGQILYSKKLQKPIDKVEIDGGNLANGLYYYSIVVDNSIKLTKTMSVIH